MTFFGLFQPTFERAVGARQILRRAELAAVKQRHELRAGGGQLILKLGLNIVGRERVRVDRNSPRRFNRARKEAFGV
jgi:hypothetical protein